MEYCELDDEAKKSLIEDFKKIGIEIRPAFIAHDITTAFKNHLEYVLARGKKASITPEKDDRDLFG